MNWYKKARFEDYNEDIQNDISEAAMSCELQWDDLMLIDGDQEDFDRCLESRTEEIMTKYYPTLRGRAYRKLFDEFKDMIWDRAHGY